MDMQPVQSSNLDAVGYDPDTQTLAIRFKSGRTYEYGSVPESEYQALISAGSVGQYFSQNIKGVYAEK